MNKIAFYKFIRKKVAKDGKTHQCLITKNGNTILDGRTYNPDDYKFNNEILERIPKSLQKKKKITKFGGKQWKKEIIMKS